MSIGIWYNLHNIQINAVIQRNPIRHTAATAAQTANPVRVGMRMASAVHLKLPVSLYTVRQVVAQGQCIKVKSMTHTAVPAVQPFAVSRA